VEAAYLVLLIVAFLAIAGTAVVAAIRLVAGSR
jgi:hypothetical protein